MASTTAPPPPAPAEALLDRLFSYDNTIMLAAIISLLLVILFVLLLHLYARWFLSGRPRPLPISTVTTYDLSPPAKDGPSAGLDPASIPAFTCTPADSHLECAVCLSHFEEGEAGRRLPRCAHCFHVDCIDTWLRAHTTCPVCRLDVVLQGNPLPAKDDADPKDHHVLLDIRYNDVASVERPGASSSPENVGLERLIMRVALSRSCRSEVARVANHRPERHRPSI